MNLKTLKSVLKEQEGDEGVASSVMIHVCNERDCARSDEWGDDAMVYVVDPKTRESHVFCGQHAAEWLSEHPTFVREGE